MLVPMAECSKLNASIGNSPVQGVIHLGAHVGEEIFQYSETGTIKSVAWFEGNKNLMKDLYDQTVRFSPTIKQYYFNEVLSNNDGEKLIFNITNNGQSSSILKLGSHLQHHPQVQVVEQREVIATRFDTWFEKNKLKANNLSDFDMINIDLQGAELKVLQGMGDLLKTLPIKIVYSEVNNEYVYENCCLISELDEYLFQFGFKRMITKWADGGKYGWGDACYFRRV